MSEQISRATREAALAAAIAKGCVVVEPKPNQLFIDIDCEADRLHFENALPRVAKRCSLVVTRSPSPSGTEGREHVVVTFTDRTFTALDRIAFQGVLGSDRARELNSVIDILDGDPLPTIFFEKAPGE